MSNRLRCCLAVLATTSLLPGCGPTKTTSLIRINKVGPASESEFATFKQTQRALVQSPFILSAALRNPKIASLSTIRGGSDPLGWLANNLQIEFPGDSELMKITLTCQNKADATKILDAVVEAYLAEIDASRETEFAQTQPPTPQNEPKATYRMQVVMPAVQTW